MKQAVLAETISALWADAVDRYACSLHPMGVQEAWIAEDPDVHALLGHVMLQLLELEPAPRTFGSHRRRQDVGLEEFDVQIEAGEPGPTQRAQLLYLILECGKELHVAVSFSPVTKLLN